MSYSFHLVRLPAGLPPLEAYRRKQRDDEQAAEGKPVRHDAGPLDPLQEQEKQRLASALMARHPGLELYRPDHAASAKALGVDEREARRRIRHLELNDAAHSIQIVLFDDSAGLSFAFTGSEEAGVDALKLVWSCLEVLEAEGGFSTYDTQIDRILDLKSDFQTVLKYACGIETDRANGVRPQGR